MDKECVWCGSSLFLLFTQDYLSEHSYSHTSLILLIAYVFFVTCILLSVCLCGWSNSHVPLIYLTIRSFRRLHVMFMVWTFPLIYRGLEILEDHKRRGSRFSLVMHCFVAVMLFTQQVFHLECLLLFQIKSQSGVAYKSVVY